MLNHIKQISGLNMANEEENVYELKNVHAVR